MAISRTTGTSFTQLCKDIKITQKSAWFILHRLRHAASGKSIADPLEGMLKADETCIDGKKTNKHGYKETSSSQGEPNKATFIDIIERLSSEYSDHYLADFTSRHDRRMMHESSRVDAMLVQVDGRLTYKALIT